MTHMKKRQHLAAAGLTVLLGAGLLAGGQPAVADEPTNDNDNLVDALERDAEPLRTTEPDGEVDDLQPLGDMVGDASVVTTGEATHSSREFVTMQQRIFRHLVEEKGFRTFAREISWSTGLLLNEYIQTGKGNPRRIMDREFEVFYQVFDNREFLDFVESLRAYNQRQDDEDDKVQLIGTDIAFPGPVLFEEVDAYLADHHPGLQPVFDALYEGLAPKRGMHLSTYMEKIQGLPVAKRKVMAAKAKAAVTLLEAHDPGDDSPHKANFETTVQHARSIAQVAKGYSFDTNTEEGMTKWGEYRDASMADNIEWWREHTGAKTMMSTFAAHASYEEFDGEHVPDPLGKVLRERLGDDHVNVGFTFARGSANTLDESDGKYKTPWVAADGPEDNEYTLDKVRYDDYLLDMRSAPATARDWLDTSRKMFAIGGSIDPDDPRTKQADVALGKSYDILVHLDQVQAAKRLF